MTVGRGRQLVRLGRVLSQPVLPQLVADPLLLQAQREQQFVFVQGEKQGSSAGYRGAVRYARDAAGNPRPKGES